MNHTEDNSAIDRLLESGSISYLDAHFARLMTRLAHREPGHRGGADSGAVSLAAALASRNTRMGHVCLDLRAVAGTRLVGGESADGGPLVCPPLESWREELMESPVVGGPEEWTPLVLDDGFRLYPRRYWSYQADLARGILARATGWTEAAGSGRLKGPLRRLFPDARNGETDWQMVAAFTACAKRFCVISGGPGTGKTTTVARILALLAEVEGTGGDRVAVVAPTGKAAARLKESLLAARDRLDCPDSIKEAVAVEAATIHRLLGAMPRSPRFRHHRDNPLRVDAVVVDEASMVDMALMSKLVSAMPPHARLILLGDRDQLASVEAGAVLADICDAGSGGYSGEFLQRLEEAAGIRLAESSQGVGPGGIGDCIVELKRSYRFASDGGMGELSRAVNAGDSTRAGAILREENYPDAGWNDLPARDRLADALRPWVVDQFGPYLRAGEPGEALDLFGRFRILCALREGPFGATAVNALVEKILAREGLLAVNRRSAGLSKWYPGRPVMVTGNDYRLRLFNGDVGICQGGGGTGANPRVFFRDGSGELRGLHPSRLPPHETAFAATVHKSQGSEFDRVLLLLAGEESPVLTRELLYTGITRARRGVTVWGSARALREAVVRRTIRVSGLMDMMGS